jgi:hypothetical protein
MGPTVTQTADRPLPTSAQAQRSISAEIFCGSFACGGAVDVSSLKVFHGSSTPMGDAIHHLASWFPGPMARALPIAGHPPQHAFDSTQRARHVHLFSCPGAGPRSRSCEFRFAIFSVPKRSTDSLAPKGHLRIPRHRHLKAVQNRYYRINVLLPACAGGPEVCDSKCG